jgi:hypothetical protein
MTCYICDKPAELKRGGVPLCTKCMGQPTLTTLTAGYQVIDRVPLERLERAAIRTPPDYLVGDLAKWR